MRGSSFCRKIHTGSEGCMKRATSAESFFFFKILENDASKVGHNPVGVPGVHRAGGQEMPFGIFYFMGIKVVLRN